MGRKWMRRGRKNSLEGEQMDCSTGKGGKVKGATTGIRKY
jgi:hypothetical protein